MKKIIDNCFYPMLTSGSENFSEPIKAILDRWKKYNLLSEKDKNILISDQTAEKLESLSMKFSFSKNKASEVSKIVRDIFFGIIEEKKILEEVRKRVDVDDIEAAVIKDVIAQIIHSQPQLKRNAEEESIEKTTLPLIQALEKFPHLGEQVVTSAPLKLRIFPEAVKPSIKNWIADYHDALGRGKHEMMERGNFLFHSENTKRLTSLERRRLAEVLKSLDDDSELSVDSQNQKIIFESNFQEAQQSARREASVAPTSPLVSAQPKVQRDFPAPKIQEIKREYTPAEIRANDEGYVLKPATRNDFSANAQEHYEIPKTSSLVPNIQEPKPKAHNSWNPTQGVRKRMAEEDGKSAIFGGLSQKNEASAKTENSVRFSSSQILPVEKKREPLKPTAAWHVFASPISTPKVSTLEPNDAKDDLIEKIRALNKKSSTQSNQHTVYKITPRGFVDRSDDSIQYQSDGDDPKVNGNVVDLSK